MRLKREFYIRDTVTVAQELLGKILVYKSNEETYKGRIVETEAYINKDDDAAHFHGGLTKRTRIVSAEGGHIYIYTIYGIYECFNIIAEEKGVHGGVLIRGIEPIAGIESMYKNRYKKAYKNPTKKELINLTDGPAKFVMAYGITKKDFYGLDLVTDPNIWVEDQPKVKKEDMIQTTRVNIDYADSRDFPLRFYIKDNPYVSRK